MNLILTRGDTNYITFRIRTEDNAPVELNSGDQLYFTVKKSFFHKACIIQKTFGNGITYDEETEEYMIELDQPCSCHLECGEYVYDIKIVLNSVEPVVVKTLIKGSFIFSPYQIKINFRPLRPPASVHLLRKEVFLPFLSQGDRAHRRKAVPQSEKPP